MPWLAGCITNTSESKFSAHTRPNRRSVHLHDAADDSAVREHVEIVVVIVVVPIAGGARGGRAFENQGQGMLVGVRSVCTTLLRELFTDLADL
jgi:hypothetical protein